MDFYKTLEERVTNRNSPNDYIVWPDFKYARSKDLVVKGGDFYAYWDGDNWVTDVDQLIQEIDRIGNNARNTPSRVVVRPISQR